MCRILSYLGKPIIAEDLLYKPDNSFIKQSYHPILMTHLLNLAGFGIVAWDSSSYQPSRPFIYKSTHLPFYDENLRNLATKINPSCLLAHLRGVSYTERQVISTQNVHPFLFKDQTLALAHNGLFYNFEKMKYDLLPYINKEYRAQIRGNTDSEWIYAVFLSRLSGSSDLDNIIQAIMDTLKIIQTIRHQHQITINSPANLFITNGEFIAATRFVFDYGWHPEPLHNIAHLAYHSLWYTFGESYGYHDNEYKMKGGGKSSIIISSEPLTQDSTTWIEVPEYSLIVARLENKAISILSQDITL